MLKVKETYAYWFEQWLELEKPIDIFEESETWERLHEDYGKEQVLSGIRHGVISVRPASDEESEREIDEIDDNDKVTLQFEHDQIIANTEWLDQEKFAEAIAEIKAGAKAEEKCIAPVTPPVTPPPTTSITPKRKPSSEVPRAPKKLRLTPVCLEDQKLPGVLEIPETQAESLDSDD